MLIRPIRPEDEPTLARFHAGLSTETVVARYGIDRPLAERTSHDRLTRICFADYDRQFAIVAEVLKDDAAAPEFAAIARVSRVHASDDRHLTMTVADAWQRRGVGACLIRAAVAVAKGEGVANLVSELSPGTRACASCSGPRASPSRSARGSLWRPSRSSRRQAREAARRFAGRTGAPPRARAAARFRPADTVGRHPGTTTSARAVRPGR